MFGEIQHFGDGVAVVSFDSRPIRLLLSSLDYWLCQLLDIPVSLLKKGKGWLAELRFHKFNSGRRTLKNSPRAELYGLHGLPLTYFWPGWSMGYCRGETETIYQIFREPESQYFEHTAQLVVG